MTQKRRLRVVVSCLLVCTYLYTTFTDKVIQKYPLQNTLSLPYNDYSFLCNYTKISNHYLTIRILAVQVGVWCSVATSHRRWRLYSGGLFEGRASPSLHKEQPNVYVKGGVSSLAIPIAIMTTNHGGNT